MQDRGRALLLCAIMVAPSSTLGRTESRATDSAPPSVVGSDLPSWANQGSRLAEAESGFAPLSVTQSGVAYTPAAPAFDPAASDQAKIADLPAWASSHFTTAPERRQSRTGVFGDLSFGALSEPAAWALILMGTAMICGAVRGLIMAHRRLERLRDDDEPAE